MKSLLVSSAVIGGAGAIILDIPKVYENVLSLIIGNNPEAGFFTSSIECIGSVKGFRGKNKLVFRAHTPRWIPDAELSITDFLFQNSAL